MMVRVVQGGMAAAGRTEVDDPLESTGRRDGLEVAAQQRRQGQAVVTQIPGQLQVVAAGQARVGDRQLVGAEGVVEQRLEVRLGPSPLVDRAVEQDQQRRRAAGAQCRAAGPGGVTEGRLIVIRDPA